MDAPPLYLGSRPIDFFSTTLRFVVLSRNFPSYPRSILIVSPSHTHPTKLVFIRYLLGTVTVFCALPPAINRWPSVSSLRCCAMKSLYRITNNICESCFPRAGSLWRNRDRSTCSSADTDDPQLPPFCIRRAGRVANFRCRTAREK